MVERRQGYGWWNANERNATRQQRVILEFARKSFCGEARCRLADLGSDWFAAAANYWKEWLPSVESFS